MAPPVLSRRALNRALLGRQLLLERSPLGIVAAIEQVVGLQAQVPLGPYAGLWSRLEGFDPHELGRLLEERQVVRAPMQRSTVHLMSAADVRRFRPVVQPVFERELQQSPACRRALETHDPAPVLASVRALIEASPRTGAEIRAHLAEHFPDRDATALAHACRNRLDVVQVPPRGVWGRSGTTRTTTLPHWLGGPLATDATPAELARRYLRAFGPASAADLAAWSGLQAQREVLDALGPELRTFRSESGMELFDVADGLLPDPDTPAPVRILPAYDNAWLGHADRSRGFATDEVRRRVWATAGHNGTVHGTVSHDGFVVATWTFDRQGTARSGSTTLVVTPALKLTKATRAVIEQEGHAFLAFHEPEGRPVDVAFAPLT